MLMSSSQQFHMNIYFHERHWRLRLISITFEPKNVARIKPETNQSQAFFSAKNPKYR